MRIAHPSLSIIDNVSVACWGQMQMRLMTDEVQCQCSLCLREELCHCICSFHKFRWITLWPTRTLMKLCMNTMMLLKPKGPSAVQTGRHDGSNSPWQRVAASDQVCLQWLTTCGVCLPTDIPRGTRWAFHHQRHMFVYCGQVVVPMNQWHNVLVKLHETHQGLQMCCQRDQVAVWWLVLRCDLDQFINGWWECREHHPVQQGEPLCASVQPAWLWLKFAANLLSFEEKTTWWPLNTIPSGWKSSNFITWQQQWWSANLNTSLLHTGFLTLLYLIMIDSSNVKSFGILLTNFTLSARLAVQLSHRPLV